MTATRKKGSFMRLLALIAVLALVAAACNGAAEPDDVGDTTPPTQATTPDDTTDTTMAPDDTTDTTMAPDDTTPDTTMAPDTAGLETYTMGAFEPTTTDSLWSYYDSSGSDVWNAYPLAPTADSLYVTPGPGFEVTASLAADAEVPAAVQEGDVWTADVTLKEGIVWSDGEPITAEDFVFTWNTAVDLALTANWPTVTTPEIVTGLEAVDDATLRVTFNAQPGLAIWGTGQGVDGMPVQPEHFWAPVVAEAGGDSATLLAASGAEAPAAGETVFVELQEGSFVATTANESYHGTGQEITSGGVTYAAGPFAQNMSFPFYGGQDAAVLALADGEVDLLLNPLGMQQGLRQQVEANPDLTAIVNPTNGYRFMAYNHTVAPTNDAAFRDAVTVLIDKEFVTQQILQGVAFPLYVLLPEGNANWYNEEVAAEAAEAGLAGAETDVRRVEAIRILTDAGYTWETAPGWVDPTAEEPAVVPAPSETENTFSPGEGLTSPDGTVIEQLEMLTPTASYDPLRAAFGNYISGVAIEMGIPIVSIPTEFGALVDDVFAVDEEGAYTVDYDIFILGYSLGSPVFPTFHGAFFATGGGSNNMGYSSEAYDAASEAFNAAQTEEEAYEAMWEMERIIAIDKPHVPLFDTGILEFYNSSRVQYPFTETLSGLQFLNGSQGTVNAS